MPHDHEHHADGGERADSEECHDGLAALGPFPGAFPCRCRPGANGVAIDEPTQIIRKIAGGGKAAGRVLLQAFQANCLQVSWNARLELARGNGFLLDNLTDRVDRIAGPERRTADQHFVEDCTQRIDVGGGADFLGLAARLFG